MARLRYEARAIGISGFALPVLVVMVFMGVSLLAAYDVVHTGGSAQHAHDDLARGLLLLLEFGLPPVAGLVAANLISNNPAVELHLSLPVRYPAVMELRLVLFLAWAALVGALTTVLVAATSYWIAPQPAPLNQLIWGAPLLWFGGAGAMLSLLLRSRVASSAILGMLWLGELFFRAFFLRDAVRQKLYLFLTLSTLKGGDAPDAPYWMANRLTLIALAIVFFGLVALLLRRNEALLSHEA